LLNLYTYSESTTDEVLVLFSEYSDQLWLSHQAATEYQENRSGIISKEAKRYAEISKSIDEVFRNLRAKKQHPYIDSSLATRLEEIEKEVNHALSMGENRLRKMTSISEDGICNRLTDLFEARVGKPFEIERLTEIYKSGMNRFARKVPPGYSDEKKQEPNRYGDLVLWSQVIDHSIAQGKSIILVTDDAKEDWWTFVGSDKVGPRRELRREFRDTTGKDIYIYSTDAFIYAANDRSTSTSFSERALIELKGASIERKEDAIRDKLHDNDSAASMFRDKLNSASLLRGSIDIDSATSMFRDNLNSASLLRGSIDIDSATSMFRNKLNSASLLPKFDTATLLFKFDTATIIPKLDTATLLASRIDSVDQISVAVNKQQHDAAEETRPEE